MDTSTLIKRLALTALGQALPPASVLSDAAHHAKLGVIGSVITGAMFSAFVLVGCFMFYNYMLTEGVETQLALAIIAGFTLLLGVIGVYAVNGQVSKAAKLKRKMTPVNRNSIGAEAETLLHHFISGLCEQPEPKEKAEQELEELSDTVAELEERIVTLYKS